VRTIQEKTHSFVKESNYHEATKEGDYIFIRKQHSIISASVGDIRISFDYVPCGDTTIIAQQIVKNNELTFRQWNPNKLNCPVEENNDPDHETVCLLCVCCPCARMVDTCF
jgi:hypothetical protein